MGKSLQERQEEMKQRIHLKKSSPILIDNSVKCINDCGRIARKGSMLCSRCTQEALTNKLRDTLPGIVIPEKSEEVMPSDSLSRLHMPSMQGEENSVKEGDHGASSELTSDGKVEEEQKESVETTDDTNENPPLFSQSSSGPTFTRRQVCQMFNIRPGTLSRWEKKGKVILPIKLVHNNQYVYTEANIESIKKFLTQQVDLTQTIQEKASTIDQAAKTKSAFRLNKRVERVVTSKLGSLGGGRLI
jgi:hypothetical protein